ncbi:MAG: hypothetical protein H7Z15_20085 [Rhizobacter sp.]|nr:hypothetical protein [Rhizobacter sp.]
MTQPFQEWTVLPHGKLVQIDENILTVVGELHMPLMDLPRRMTVVRLRDTSLVIFSAISLDEDEMSALEAYGRPAVLMVPSDKHRLDAKTWKDRYPEIEVAAPEGAREKVEETVAVDTVSPRFDDPNVQFVTVPGTRGREAALVIRTHTGTTLLLNDVIGNIRDAAGFGGWLLHLAGFAGKEAQIPAVVKMAVIEDKKALRAQLLQWSEIDSLVRIMVSHGSPIEDNPRQVLRELAESLS